MSSNVKKVFVKLNWLKSYWAVNFVFSAILLLFLEIWWSLECHIFLTKWGFQKLFSHSSSSLSTLSKLLTCNGISWNLYFAVNLMTSFSRQKPLKSKIQKHTIVGKTKLYYRAKSQLKRLKIEKLVWKRSLFDDSWPGVFVKMKKKNSGCPIFVKEYFILDLWVLTFIFGGNKRFASKEKDQEKIETYLFRFFQYAPDDNCRYSARVYFPLPRINNASF